MSGHSRGSGALACCGALWLTSLAGPAAAATQEPGLLFYVSGNKGTTADFAAGGQVEPNFSSEVTTIPDGAKGPALRCGGLQRLAWWAPGNIYAQRGTLAFFWRSREPVGPTEFPIFRVGYADHSSWDMVWLRIDYNGHGFDAFVTDASLSRTRVSVALPAFPKPEEWVHLALSWDETRGIRFYVNGKLAAVRETVAVYNAALDQLGPHSRIISPYQVQSDYNFVRGGDVDEIRLYDRMLGDDSVSVLARGDALSNAAALPARDTGDARWRDEWWLRYGWNRAFDPPPYLAAAATSVRKVEIHDAYDLKRWWWKANDGIRETTWPGVYNRSRLPGRNDYFQLPDWDCYSLSGKSITFTMPQEPWNHVEISGAAWGKAFMRAGAALFERPKGQEKTIHRLAAPVVGQRVRFENVEQEEPIGEWAAYNVGAGREPAGSARLEYRLTATAPDEPALAELVAYVNGRHPPDERAMMVARPADAATPRPAAATARLPLLHVLIPDTWDSQTDGLDGIALELPALNVKPTHGGLFPINIQVKDPLWPLRNMLDFTFSVKPGEARTLWLDLRDRLLPAGKSLYITLAGAGSDFTPALLEGSRLRLVFKPRQAARAEHELDRFTQARDSYAMLVEEHPTTRKLNLWTRFEADLRDLSRVNPEHFPGRNYAAVAFPGAPRPPFVQAEPPAGVPLWAFRQVDLLGRVKRFVSWYIDHRQIENGELGGGLSDDTDLTNTWPGVALMGSEPDKLKRSLRAVLDACYAHGMFTNGLPTIQADELHSYEEGINALGENLILDHGSPKQLERAMETVRGVAGITGVNGAGHRHIRSSYYSGTKLAEEGPWGWSKSYSYLVLQPGYLLVDYNGNPTAKKTILELADGLLAHGRPESGGRFSLPSAIHFASDQEGIATRIRLPWPLFWAAWRWTGSRHYLAPILDGDPGALSSVNANALDLLDLRKSWGERLASAPRGESQGDAHFAWQVSGDKRHLETLYAQQIESAALREYINTEGSLWIDRVDVPHAELQRARLGGVALVRNGLFPGHAVSWRFEAPASDQSLAILIPDATPTALKIIAYNLETRPVRAILTGWNVDPGVWDIVQGQDSDLDDVADTSLAAHTARFERTRTLELSFAPRATTIVTLKLKTPGKPYWDRPDLGIDPEDVTVDGRLVRVRVHSLGSVDAPPAQIVVRTRAGKLAASATIPALAAPLDLLPRTTLVELLLPPGTDPAEGTVEIDPDHLIEEITASNNRARFSVVRSARHSRNDVSARAAAPRRASPAPPGTPTRSRR